MNAHTHIGNITLILDGPVGGQNTCILLGTKRPKQKADERRKRKKVGSGYMVPPGGATKPSDKSQKHAAQREVREETGLTFPLAAFKKVAILRGYFDEGAPTWLVHIYMVSDIMVPQPVKPNEEFQNMGWYLIYDPPFGSMMSGDLLWLPQLLKGQKLSIRLRFAGDTDKVVSHTLQPLIRKLRKSRRQFPRL
jgi:8-oxo-dGTP pyrophosphatase MutT (NUDIX family)